MEIKKTIRIITISIVLFLLLNMLFVCYGKIQCNRMIDAIRSNDIDKLESILRFANPNTVPGVGVIDAITENIDRETPLGAACREGNYEMVKLLVENGADVNYIPLNAYPSPLILAVQSKSVDNLKIVKFLFENGVDIDNSNLKTMYPARGLLRGFELPPNGMEILKVLMEAGAETENKVILQVACYWKHDEVIRYLVEEWGCDAADPLYLCEYCYGVEKYSYDTFKYFLEKGANPYERDEDGKCAIDYLKEESPEAAEKLIELAAEYGFEE